MRDGTQVLELTVWLTQGGREGESDTIGYLAPKDGRSGRRRSGIGRVRR